MAAAAKSPALDGPMIAIKAATDENGDDEDTVAKLEREL